MPRKRQTAIPEQEVLDYLGAIAVQLHLARDRAADVDDGELDQELALLYRSMMKAGNRTARLLEERR
jgi:hypothetical protein